MPPSTCVWIDWSVPEEHYALLLALQEYGTDGRSLADELRRHAKRFFYPRRAGTHATARLDPGGGGLCLTG